MPQHVFIIAEAGCNHNGSLKIAKELIKKAKSCAADAVKFQIFNSENLVRADAAKKAHLKNINNNDSVLESLKKLEFKKQDYLGLVRFAQNQKIVIFASVFDIQSLNLANELNMPIIKIPSGEIVNLELIKAAALTNKPIILSTGMATMQEIKAAVDIILKSQKSINSSSKFIKNYPVFKKGLMLMHTVSCYPALSKELNLQSINTMHSYFKLPIGYSDHATKNLAILASVSMGAVAVEKHFTLNRNMAGPDHKASIEPSEFKKMIKDIRVLEEMMGNGKKLPTKTEKTMIAIFRKSIIAACDIRKNEKIKRNMLDIKRPLNGIGCEFLYDVAGSYAVKNIKSGASLKWKDLKCNK